LPQPFRVSRRVEFAETDMAGIVHFSNFFRYMESAEVAFLRQRGLSVSMSWEGQHVGLPRVAAACDFFRPVSFEDVIDIAVTLQKIGRTSLTYQFDFFKDGEPVARGRITCVCCRRGADGRWEAWEIPAAIRELLEGEG
jgi:YbgC/YbaW family acyl-CoA thioester hydrolase